tara:strand:- start:103 stop:291 length:189 start_codon:yes stop_codon:yes gene_type:complete
MALVEGLLEFMGTTDLALAMSLIQPTLSIQADSVEQVGLEQGQEREPQIQIKEIWEGKVDRD